MATPTYTPIESKTLGSNTAIVEFTSIPQTYTDLVLVINGKSDTSTVNVYAQVGNGSYDTGTNYSWTWLGGSGSTAASGRGSTTDALLFGASGTSSFSPTIIHFQNYSNTTTYKTMISRSSTADTTSGQTVSAWVGLWRSTSAINRIKLYPNVQNWVAGTIATLYGIKAVGGDTTPKATGGVVTSDSTYYYHTFLGSNTFTPLQSLTADILVVAGGGGNSNLLSGGGGAGGLLTFTSQALTAQPYTILVGAGGTGGATVTNGTNGGNSQFGALTTCLGGGFAGHYNTTTGSNGNSGGSGGGGGCGDQGANGGSGGAGTSGQGYAGGAGYNGESNGSGGGGGAGGVGESVSGNTNGGAGGIGATSALINAIGSATGYGQLSGGNYYFAGGGGGGTQRSYTQGAGGLGGGGTGGSAVTSTQPTNGTLGTGGGAGGGGGGGATAITNGGSGIVVVRYAK